MENIKLKRCPNGSRKNKKGECVAKDMKKAPTSIMDSILKMSNGKGSSRSQIPTQAASLSQKDSSMSKKITQKQSQTNLVKNKTIRKRCPKNMRKNKQGVCIKKNPVIFSKIPEETVKLLPASIIKLDTIEQQCDYYNSSQNDFIFKNTGNNIIIKNKHDGTICGSIIIKDKDYIYIDIIGKCGTATGTAVIKAIEDFAQKCKYRKIGLEDDSRLGTETFVLPEGGVCTFFLAGLSILSTGETWYNRLGYKSEW